MHLVILAAAGAALAVYAHRNPAGSTGALDPWSFWLIRNEKPTL